MQSVIILLYAPKSHASQRAAKTALHYFTIRKCTNVNPVTTQILSIKILISASAAYLASQRLQRSSGPGGPTHGSRSLAGER